MKRILKKLLAFMLAMAMSVSVINVPVYAQTTGEILTVNEGWDGVTTESVYEAEDYRVTFSLTSYWATGYNANIKVENTGDSTIENWYLGFNYNDVITNIWNAQIFTNVEDEYIIKNAGWNQDIAVGGSIEFGISGSNAFKGFPKSYTIIGTTTEVGEEDYIVEYQLYSDWGSGYSAAITITNNSDTVLEEWGLAFDFDREITDIWNGVIESHEGNHYVISNAGYNANIAAGESVSFGFNGCGGDQDDSISNYVLYAYGEVSIAEDLTRDSDNDGADDYIENYFGTDKTKSDTDGDGLSDYIEIYALVLDPLKADTDDNDINDGDEDLDADGLSNISEFMMGTGIVYADTDDDGLNDYDEVKVYGTEPTDRDTDADGVSDLKETELGTNPLVYEETFDMYITAKEDDTVKVSVEVMLPGEQAESLTVKKYENDLLFPTNMPGYIGGVYDFSVDGEFDTATITFEFDESLLEDASFDPVIYYFNEETQLLEALDTTLNGNAASAKVTHFSKYILLNRYEQEENFGWMDSWEENTGYSGVELVFVIDDSGSMLTYDKTNERLEVARNLIDKLPGNSKVGVVRFENSTDILTTSITADKELAKSYLTTGYFKSYGSTYMYEAINEAFSLYESTDDDIMKVMVVLSDGASSDAGMHSSVVSAANSKNVKIYTVGLGNGSSWYFTNYLNPLAIATSGKFYLAENAGQLEDIYDDINVSIDIKTDSDGDGISDYYEENLAMFNGVAIKTDKDNPDTDGDGLLDGEEVALLYFYRDNNKKVRVLGAYQSNPLEEDTDGDGLFDDEEVYYLGTEPMEEDTDGDGLDDGTEVDNWYNPLEADEDGDGRLDLKEYKDGTSPYRYDKAGYEHGWDFLCGFIAGDFIKGSDSYAVFAGQLTSSLCPIADVRDVIGNCVNGDYVFAGLSAAGALPLIGDITKAGGKVLKFVTKNLDNLPEVSKMFEFLLKNFPEVIPYLGKSDEFIDIAKQISKTDIDKLTKKDIEAINEALKKAGLPEYVIKGSSDVIQSKFNKLLNSDYYKTDLGYDCSEIAQDFYDAAGQQGKIYRIEGKSGYINGYEYNNQVEYIYHEVYSDGTYIYDPRYTNVPVLKDDYFRALREINPDGFDVFEIME